tara:strand:+ start:1023 stop:1361 length:339 start_codon:yes stop_codon:yes gene_type:complete
MPDGTKPSNTKYGYRTISGKRHPLGEHSDEMKGVQITMKNKDGSVNKEGTAQLKLNKGIMRAHLSKGKVGQTIAKGVNYLVSKTGANQAKTNRSLYRQISMIKKKQKENRNK